MNIEDRAPKEDKTYVLFCGSLITPSRQKIFRPRFHSPSLHIYKYPQRLAYCSIGQIRDGKLISLDESYEAEPYK